MAIRMTTGMRAERTGWFKFYLAIEARRASLAVHFLTTVMHRLKLIPVGENLAVELPPDIVTKQAGVAGGCAGAPEIIRACLQGSHANQRCHASPRAWTPNICAILR